MEHGGIEANEFALHGKQSKGGEFNATGTPQNADISVDKQMRIIECKWMKTDNDVVRWQQAVASNFQLNPWRS